MQSSTNSSLRSGAEPRQQGCRRCDGGCGHSESINSSNIVQRVLVRPAGLTGYGGGPSRYEPPPPYSGPVPLLDAPPPPYFGPPPPYYGPPPRYSETEPAPRQQTAPVQNEASRSRQLNHSQRTQR